MALAYSVQDKLHGKRREQDAGNASDNVYAGYAEQAPDRLYQHQHEVSQRQGNKQRQEKDGDS